MTGYMLERERLTDQEMQDNIIRAALLLVRSTNETPIEHVQKLATLISHAQALRDHRA